MDVREKSSNGKRLIDVDEAIINFGFEWDDIPPTREEFVRFLKKQPIIDAVPAVRCEKCVAHGSYFAERVFVYTGIENPYCCAGERKEGAD